MLHLQLFYFQGQSFHAFAAENSSITLSKSWYDLNVSYFNIENI